MNLRGLSIDAPKVAGRSTVRLIGGGNHEITRLAGVTELKKADLVDLDLTGARLPSLILTGCRVRNCVFDGAVLDSLGSFGSSFEDTSFQTASLRDAGLGGTDGGRRSTFDRVRFDRAKMDGVMPGSATFTDCDFGSARLKGAEFWNAKLIRCRFEGRLEKVIFAARRPILGVLGHEETLIDVDFSAASFQWVEFRGLNLARVTLPSNAEHILVRHPRCVLDQLLAELGKDPAPDADQRGFAAIVKAELEWLGPAQAQMVFATRDLARTDAGRARAATMIRDAADACSSS